MGCMAVGLGADAVNSTLDLPQFVDYCLLNCIWLKNMMGRNDDL